MNTAVIIGIVLAALLLLAGIIAVAMHFVAERAEQRRRIARQQVVLEADEALRESTRATLRAMNDAVKRSYRQQ